MGKVSVSYYKLEMIDDKEKHLSPADNNIGEKLYDYCKKITEYSGNEKLKKVFLTNFFDFFEEKIDDKINYYCVHSVLQTGNYGTDGELVRSENGEFKSNGTFTNKDAVTMPFGWALYYNKRETFCILAIQHNGLYNILDLVKTIFTDVVKGIPNNISIKINPFIPNYYFTKLIDKNELHELQIVKTINNYDNSDSIGNKKGIFSPKIKKTYYNPILDKDVLKKVFNERNIDAILEFESIDDTNEYIENIIIKNKDGKSINFSRMHATKIMVDISSEIEKISGSEHPTISSLFKSIDSNVMEYLKYYKISVDNYSEQARSTINVYTRSGGEYGSNINE